MHATEINKIVEQVIRQLKQKAHPFRTIPIGVSARHVHLSPDHVEKLFGKGYRLTRRKALSQPGQYAAEETVMVAGGKSVLEKVRILGPPRGRTQVEVSLTDAVKLGSNPPLRESGDLKGAAPVTLIGPKGSVHVEEGMIIAKRHIHMTPKDALEFGVQNGEYVGVETGGDRYVTFDRVLIRVSDQYRLEMHIDTDEANAAMLKTGETVRLVKKSGVEPWPIGS
ncbi:phosphate propanoyltransferase [Melghirimyces profundicolus]|nr:phosphate propanoyltransferase [Melghirimyces profundicolus]